MPRDKDYSYYQENFIPIVFERQVLMEPEEAMNQWQNRPFLRPRWADNRLPSP